jgi:hypothetical protein
MVFCPKCGAELKKPMRFCNHCGARLDASADAAPPPAGAPAQPAGPAPAQPRQRTQRQSSRRAPDARAQSAPASASAERIPEELLPLLGYIARKTVASFFRQLPLSIALGGAALLAHTYLLVVVNEGFAPQSTVGKFLALQGNTLSGSLIWMVGSALLTGLIGWLSGKRPKVGIAQRIEAVRRYLSEAPMDAYSVIAGGVGFALFVSGFTNSTANLVLAVGMGAFLASKAGSALSLLVRTAWNTLFSVVRRENVRKYGMAAGYAAVLASSLGFIATSVLPVGGFVPGLMLLGAAVAFGMRGQTGPTSGVLVLLAGAAAALVFAHPGAPLAHDGGWQEAGGTLEGWLRSQGALQAVLQGLGPALAAIFGPLLVSVLRDLGLSVPDLDGEPAQPPQPEAEPTSPPATSSGLIDPETGDPLIEHDGVSYEGGQKGQVWFNGKWMDRKDVEALIDRHQKDNPLYDPRTGDYLIVHDGKSYEGGKAGQVWFEGRWMDRSEAIKALNQVRTDVDRQNEQIRQEQHQWALQQDAKRIEDLKAKGFVFDKEQNAWVPGPNYQKSASQLERELQERHEKYVLEKAQRLGEKEGGALQKEIDRLIKEGKFNELKQVYRGYWEKEIRENAVESVRQLNVAQMYGYAEVGAKVTLAASKGALMVLGGPAGWTATALTVGAVSAAQEGAEVQAAGGSAGDVAWASAGGFLSGAKDGVIGRYVNLPGTSSLAKVALPAAADTLETYIRTGDVTRSLATGAVSAVGDLIGLGTDGLKGGITKELIGLGTSAVTGGTLSVINGGDFGEGVKDGLINHVGGRIGAEGGRVGGDLVNPDLKTKADYDKEVADHEKRVQRTEERQQQGRENEALVSKAVAETSAERKQVIPTEKQPEIIQNLDKSRYDKVVTDPSGKVKLNDRGEPVTEPRVDTRQALEQLQDTKSSRTAKQAEPELRDAIVKTRAEEIYAPADRQTIDKASGKPEVQSMMKPGDELVMDTFSTPGKPPSLGADRDARLVIKRPNPDNPKGFDYIEVPRKHWENDAYKDFYDHTIKIAGGRENVTADTHPEFFRRREELSYLSKAGMSQEQIDARAWAEAHNQLFTDRHHMEASRDNADQVLKVGPGSIEPGQQKPNVQRVQEGTSDKLDDPAGVARMWDEKSRFYEHNTPEALAQAQKGIESHMKVRDGLRQQGIEPPPLDSDTARAMDLISRAPVGQDATPEAIGQLNTNLQKLGYKNVNDAMSKIASQNENLKWSKPQGYQPPAPEGPNALEGLSPGATVRVARDTLEPQKPTEDEA